jgi:hypothetical protein
VLTTVACLFLAPAAARADLISWSYSWDQSPLAIAADGHGTGSVNLAANPGGTVVGNSNIVAVNLNTGSAAPVGTPDTFTHQAYALTLTLTDGPSQASGQLTFAGHFDGTLSATSAALQNTFDGATSQTLQLGHDLYTVTVGPYAPPGAPNATLSGSISAFVSVTAPVVEPQPPPLLAQRAPEPATLVLAALAVPLGALAWRRCSHRTTTWA